MLSIKAQVWLLFTSQPCVEIMMTRIMFEHETAPTPFPPFLSVLIERSVYVGAYSTSLSSRAIGSALVGRLKLQSRVASRRKRGRTRPNQDQTKERSRRLWVVFFDRRWSDRIGPGIYGEGWYGDDSRQEHDGYWFAPRAFPISSRRFKGRRYSST